MSTAYQIVVCGSIVPDPLQTLDPVASPENEHRLPRRHGQPALGGELEVKINGSSGSRVRDKEA